MRRLTWALALTLPAATNAALAADPSPVNGTPPQQPDMVVTATRVETPIVDIPAGVSVVDRQTIEVRDYTNLAEALSAIPGVRVSQSGGPGGNASVFVRGTNSNDVLVLRDGMPLNDASDSTGAFNFGIDTLGDVERIEVIRGPMAALYGSGAIGGVINLITRRGTGQGPIFTGDLAGGYPAQILGNANASGVNGPVDYFVNAEAQAQQGFDVTPRRERIYTGVPDGYQAYVGTLNLGYTPVEGTRLSLLLRARSGIFGFNALGSPTFDNSNSTGHDDQLLGRVGVTSKLFGGSVETGLFVGHLQQDRHYSEPLNALDPNQAFNNSRYHAYRTDVQWNNTVHLNDYFSSSVLSATDATFGYEYTADYANVNVNSASFGSPFSQGASAHLETNAVYAGLQSTVLDRLTLTGQLRQDWVESNQPTTWRVGGVFDVREINTHLKASYGTAFRVASLFDRYGVDSFGFIGNPNLKPESSQGWEAGFTTDVPGFGRPNLFTFGATYFNNQIHNLITTVFSPVYTAVNIGSAHIQGVESEFSLRPAPWLTATVAYTYTDPINVSDNTQLLRRPQNTFSVNSTIKPVQRLTIAPEILYTGQFRDFLVDNTGTATANVGTSKSGLIFNLTATYQVAENIQLYLAGRNLSNTHFEPVNGYQTPGASFLGGTRVRF